MKNATSLRIFNGVVDKLVEAVVRAINVNNICREWFFGIIQVLSFIVRYFKLKISKTLNISGIIESTTGFYTENISNFLS
jgi:hypothetical protein